MMMSYLRVCQILMDYFLMMMRELSSKVFPTPKIQFKEFILIHPHPLAMLGSQKLGCNHSVSSRPLEIQVEYDFVGNGDSTPWGKPYILDSRTMQHVYTTPKTQHNCKELMSKIQGQDNMYFCGAWTMGGGIHEVAIISAYRVVNQILLHGLPHQISMPVKLACLVYKIDGDLNKLTLVGALEKMCALHGNQVAYVFVDEDGYLEEITWECFCCCIYSTAGLISRRSTQGDNLRLCYPPGMEFVVSFFACLETRCIPVPVMSPFPQNVASGVEKLKYIKENSGANISLTTKGYHSWTLLQRIVIK